MGFFFALADGGFGKQHDMKTKHNIKTAPVAIPVIPRVDAPASDVVILETLYRKMGLPTYPAIAAAWSDFEMFRNGPPGERRLIT